MALDDTYHAAVAKISEASRSRTKHLDLSRLRLTQLPPSVGSLAGLETLSLEYNYLETLPDEITHLKQLRALLAQIGHQS